MEKKNFISYINRPSQSTAFGVDVSCAANITK